MHVHILIAPTDIICRYEPVPIGTYHSGSEPEHWGGPILKTLVDEK